MKDSTKDKVAGEEHEVKTAVKEKLGYTTKYPGLEHQGQGERIGGKVQKKVREIARTAEK